MHSKRIQGYVSALFATMFMGSLGVFVKNINLHSGIITFFRLFIAAVLIMLMMIATKDVKKFKKPPSLNIVLSGAAVASNVLFYVAAIKLTSMSVAAFLLYLGPVFASLSAFIFLKERLRGLDILSLVLSVIGILFMFKFDFHFNNINTYGMIFGILSGFSYGIAIFANRTIDSKIDLSYRSFYQFLLGALVALPFFIFHFDKAAILSNLITLIAMSIVCGFFGITLMFNAIKHLPAVEYGVLSYLEMFFAVLFGVLFFKESLGLFKIIGGLSIFISGMLQIFKVKLYKT